MQRLTSKLILGNMDNTNTTALVKLISDTVKQKRESLGMSQYELAAKMNVPQSTVARLEKGEMSPSASTMERLFKTLNITIKLVDQKSDKTFQVANYILDKSKQILNNEFDISNLKLNRILYFVYKEGLKNKKQLFSNDFKISEFGPIHIEVFNKFKSFGLAPISTDELYFADVSRSDMEIIDSVLNDKVKYSNSQLKDLLSFEKGLIKLSALTQEDISDDFILK